MKFSQPKFEWDEVTRTAHCYISIDDSQLIIGSAKCCPEDYDMSSEKTGCEIAYYRASIKLVQHFIMNDITPRLNALKQLYYSINHSSQYNPKSYESRMIRRQLRLVENELAIAKEMVVERKEQLKEYLKKKEEFYEMVRSMRRVKEEEAKHQDNN